MHGVRSAIRWSGAWLGIAAVPLAAMVLADGVALRLAALAAGVVIAFAGCRRMRALEIENAQLRHAKRLLCADLDAPHDAQAQASHELRTPLSAIKGAATILSNGQLSGEQARFVDMIESNAERLQKALFEAPPRSELQVAGFKPADMELEP